MTLSQIRSARFAIGTMFETRHKRPKLCTVVDILTTYNNAGELVSIRYVATHEVLGQTVIDRDVVETTIAMGLIKSKDCQPCHCGDSEPHKFTDACIPF